jgi:hypothetical protein
MAKAQSEATHQIEAERYQVEHVRLAAGSDALAATMLQEAVNKGARQSLRLVGVAQDPMSQSVLVVWDTSVSSPGPSRGKRS